jgi:hypothetical protein
MTMPEDTGRGHKWILARTEKHLRTLKAIEKLGCEVIRPRGRLVYEVDPRTQRHAWICRTREGTRPQVLVRDILFIAICLVY